MAVNQHHVRAPGAFATVADDELIILDEADESFLSSNAVAVALWEALSTPITVPALVDMVTETFAGTDRATVTADVEEFIETLSARGLVVAAPPA